MLLCGTALQAPWEQHPEHRQLHEAGCQYEESHFCEQFFYLNQEYYFTSPETKLNITPQSTQGRKHVLDIVFMFIIIWLNLQRNSTLDFTIAYLINLSGLL